MDENTQEQHMMVVLAGRTIHNLTLRLQTCYGEILGYITVSENAAAVLVEALHGKPYSSSQTTVPNWEAYIPENNRACPTCKGLVSERRARRKDAQFARLYNDPDALARVNEPRRMVSEAGVMHAYMTVLGALGGRTFVIDDEATAQGGDDPEPPGPDDMIESIR